MPLMCNQCTILSQLFFLNSFSMVLPTFSHVSPEKPCLATLFILSALFLTPDLMFQIRTPDLCIVAMDHLFCIGFPMFHHSSRTPFYYFYFRPCLMCYFWFSPCSTLLLTLILGNPLLQLFLH